MEDQSKQPDRRQELMVVRAQLRDAEAKLIEFNEQLDSIKDLENRVEFLNNETTRLEAEADANQAEMQNYKDEISKLREGATQSNLLSAELERQQSLVDELHATKNELETQIEEQNNTQAQSERTIADLENAISKLEQKIVDQSKLHNRQYLLDTEINRLHAQLDLLKEVLLHER